MMLREMERKSDRFRSPSQADLLSVLETLDFTLGSSNFGTAELLRFFSYKKLAHVRTN
jgi:hypothetical protein